MPRFVILQHDHPELHWDFMLECGAVLKTWRLQDAPRPGLRILAEALVDHRPLYLDYEGPVSGNRGQVQRWDGGLFEWLAPLSTVGGRVRLEGNRLRGVAVLERDSFDQWSFTWEGV